MNWPLLLNSLLIAAAAAAGAASLGFLVALWLTGTGERRRAGALAVTLAALAMPSFLVVNCWLDLLGANGLLRPWLPEGVGLYHLGGAAALLTLLFWPLPCLAVWSAWRPLSREQLESEPALRGAQLLRWLLWPAARKPLALATALVFVLALNNFAVPSILQVKVLPAEVWLAFNTRLDSGAALQIAWPLILVPLLFLVWLARRWDFAWPRAAGMPAPLFRQQLGAPLGFGAAAAAGAAMALSVAVPLAELLGGSSLHCLAAAALSDWPVAWNSFWTAAGAATLTTAAGALVWMASNRRAILLHKLAGPLLWLPFFVPGVLLGIALIFCLNRPGLSFLYISPGVMLLALALRYFGPGWHGARLALAAADPTLVDAARLEGARGWALFRLGWWPQVKTPLGIAWYCVYLLCLWDVETLVLIQPPGGETLALRVFNLLHYGHNAQVNALCLGLLLLAVLPLGVWWLFEAAKGITPKSEGNPKSESRKAPALSAARHKLRPDNDVSGFGIRDSSGFRTSAFGFSSVFMGAACLGLLAGCQPSADAPSARLDSRFFARADVIGGRGNALGQFSKPRSVAVDRQDNLYAVDMTGRVQKFSSTGQYLLSWQMPETDLGKAKGMAMDHAGNIIVVEPHYQRLNHFTPEARLVAQWGVRGTNAGQFILPRAVAVNAEGDIYVSEYTQVDRVQAFRGADKTLLHAWGRSGSRPGEFNRPEGLGIDSSNRVYVADSCNHRIQVFDARGRFLRAYGKPGSGLGELSYPYDVRVDAEGNQYVCEFGNSRIQVFDALDRPVEIIGGPGGAPGRFNNPWGLALDRHGNLYVADGGNHRVQKLVRKAGAGNPPGTLRP